MSAFDFAALDLSRAERVGERVGYRSDIDGIRAVAVLAVVGSHAGVLGCAGGFVGVDVFFVISGYLIAGNLGRSPLYWRAFLAFYGRRVRRTLPALYFVAAVCLVAAWWLLLPGELDDLARSLVAALLFVPNVLFLNQAGYFDHAAISKPLLHTWSLGVEEQVYLGAPLLILGLGRLQACFRIPLLVGLAVASLAGCLALESLTPAAAFYLMPARLWEFLAGALVAEKGLPLIRVPWIAETLAGMALAAIGAAIGLFSSTTTHPGLPTLLPVAATAALIHVGRSRETRASALLASPPLVVVGLISYSIYLWHWPLLAVGRVLHLDPSPAGQLGLLAALLGLAALTWRLVEQPFRDPASLLRRRASLVLPATAISLATLALAVIVGRGFPGRFSPEVAAVASFYDYNNRKDYREGSCFLTSHYPDATLFDRGSCLSLASDRHNILLIGDSHAAHLWAGFKRVFAADNVMQATASGCKPLLHTTGKGYCVALMREVLGEFLPRHRVDVVYLSAAWNLEDAADLVPTLAFLRQHVGRVVVIGRVPGHLAPLPTLLARSLLKHNDKLVLSEQSAYSSMIDRLFRPLMPAGEYVSLTDALCHRNVCQVWAAPDVPMQFDGDHLTSAGSYVVGQAVAEESEPKPPVP